MWSHCCTRAPVIRRWLDEGKFVILDRYVYSNVAYQCAKIGDAASRERLRDWIVDLEYDYHKIPQPDVSLFLDVPFGFTRRKLEEVREGDDRGYLHGKKDIHEASLTLQQRVREVYLGQAERDDRFRVVDCAGDDAAAAADFRADPGSIGRCFRKLACEPFSRRRYGRGRDQTKRDFPHENPFSFD